MRAATPICTTAPARGRTFKPILLNPFTRLGTHCSVNRKSEITRQVFRNGQVATDTEGQIPQAGAFPELPIRKSRRPTLSRNCRPANPGSRRFPALADPQIPEVGAFPDLPIGKSRKPVLSRTCRPANAGSRRFPGLADRQIPEAGRFPEMPAGKSGKLDIKRNLDADQEKS